MLFIINYNIISYTSTNIQILEKTFQLIKIVFNMRSHSYLLTYLLHFIIRIYAMNAIIITFQNRVELILVISLNSRFIFRSQNPVGRRFIAGYVYQTAAFWVKDIVCVLAPNNGVLKPNVLKVKRWTAFLGTRPVIFTTY